MYYQPLENFALRTLEKLVFSFPLPRALSRAGDGPIPDDSVRVVAGDNNGESCGKRGGTSS